MRCWLLLLAVFFFSNLFCVSALDVNFTCPDEVYFNETFTCSVEIYDVSSSYDIKTDILGGGKRISQIFDDSEGKWKSSNYYVNNFISADGKKNIKLKVNVDFFGEATGTIKIRKNGKTTIDYGGNFSLNVVKRLTSNEEKEENIADENLTEENMEDIINVQETVKAQASKSDEVKMIVLNTEKNDQKEKVIYESKNEIIKKYSIYAFCLFLIFLIAVILIKR